MSDGAHDDDPTPVGVPTGRAWRVRTVAVEMLEATLNALEDAGYAVDGWHPLDSDDGPPRFLVAAVLTPEFDEDEEPDDEERRPLPDATCEGDVSPGARRP